MGCGRFTEAMVSLDAVFLDWLLSWDFAAGALVLEEN
jgi:hypothetical protein